MANKETEKGEQKFAADVILESMVDSLAVVDVNGKVVQENKALAEMFGVKTLIGKSITEFIVKEDISQVLEATKKIFTTGAAVTDFQFTAITKDGKKLPILANNTPLKDEKGKTVGFIAVFRNITEHKKLQEALKENEWHYRTFLQTVPDIIYEVNAKGKFIFVSEGIRRLGYNPEELIGKHFSRIIHPDDVKAISRLPVLKKNEGKITGDEDSAKLFDERRTGRRMARNLQVRLLVENQKEASKDYRYAEVHSSGKWGPDAKAKGKTFLGSIGIIRDITHLKEVEEKLRQDEAFNFALFEYNPIETIAVDLEGKVTMFNLAKKNSGDSLPDIGDVMYKDYAGKHQIDMYAELMECIKRNKQKKFPEQKYGDKFLSVVISPFPHGAIIISQDITERKKAEKKVERFRKELRESKEELIDSGKLAFTGRIAANIAHEIRNPLTNVSMSVQQVRKLLESEKGGAKHIEIIMRNIERVNYLITELLNSARPRKLNLKPYNIHRVLKDILTSMKDKISWQKIKVVKKFSSKPLRIKIDKEQIERAFSNIIINAIQSMPKGGKLTIATKADGEVFAVKIQDTGKGIREGDIIKIFDPFFSSRSDGVGLGLTICYGIIVSHRGTIEVESKLKEGSVFTISLPID